jgi:hypothetical protein
MISRRGSLGDQSILTIGYRQGRHATSTIDVKAAEQQHGNDLTPRTVQVYRDDTLHRKVGLLRM